jgi:hypothetical protein
VVKALLEFGGRELLMLTTHNGASCLSIARHYNRILRKLLRHGTVAGRPGDGDRDPPAGPASADAAAAPGLKLAVTDPKWRETKRVS